MYVKEDAVRPFEFATLQITGTCALSLSYFLSLFITSIPFATDEDDIGFSRPDVSKLGVIEVQFFRVVILGANTEPRTFHTAFETDAVSEKAKKVGWHRTSYVTIFSKTDSTH